MRRAAYFLVCLAAILLVVHGWQWIVVHLSQQSGTSNSASRAYDFWSGIGGLITIVGGLVAFYRVHNCHVRLCPWLAHHAVEGTPYKVCLRHHPGTPDKRRHLTHDHIKEASSS
jgi:hypothetical protein